MKFVAGLAFVVVLSLGTHVYSAENRANTPATYTAEQRAALDVLDGAIARFQALLDRDDDAPHKAATHNALDGFKQRRAALDQTYDQGHYDELRIDLNLEYQRLASWMAPPTTPPMRPSTTTPSTREK